MHCTIGHTTVLGSFSFFGDTASVLPEDSGEESVPKEQENADGLPSKPLCRSVGVNRAWDATEELVWLDELPRGIIGSFHALAIQLTWE